MRESNQLLFQDPKTAFCLLAVDVGPLESGIAVINIYDNQVAIQGFHEFNIDLVRKIGDLLGNKLGLVLIEDIRPYGQKVSKDVLDTIKYIGELSYRLRAELGVPFELVTRNEVRKWVFERFGDLCVERIDKKIAYLDDYGARKNKRRYRNKDGELRRASYHYVDDRIIIEAMKQLWAIPKAKPFKKNPNGFSAHSWQALALGSWYYWGKYKEKSQ